jgi:hypothetical protein|tara:strand:- start:56 stop:898 length:843 start_codon:yes stop_codon:yes gene_type:complete
MIIWLASYPKSGNTWVRSFLSTYYYSNNGTFNVDLLNNIKQYPSPYFFEKKIEKSDEISKYWSITQANILKQKGYRILKTHNSLTSINSNPFTTSKYTIGVIYVLRDPRNVLSSLKNHYALNYKEALDFMLSENKYIYDNQNLDNIDYSSFHFLGSWSNHYKSWTKTNMFRTMVIKYEDLITKPSEIFRDLVIFVNTLSKNNEPINLQKFNSSIESTNFDNLQKIEENGLFIENTIHPETKKKIKFFNLGPKNSWKNNLPENLKKDANISFKKDLEELGY